MGKGKILADKYKWALSDKAASLMEEFEALGFDPDLAFELVKKSLPETEVFDFEDYD